MANYKPPSIAIISSLPSCSNMDVFILFSTCNFTSPHPSNLLWDVTLLYTSSLHSSITSSLMTPSHPHAQVFSINNPTLHTYTLFLFSRYSQSSSSWIVYRNVSIFLISTHPSSHSSMICVLTTLLKLLLAGSPRTSLLNICSWFS